MTREIATPKFHVSDDGITRPCPAKTENGCRLQHFGSEDKADQWKKENWTQGTESHRKSTKTENTVLADKGFQEDMRIWHETDEPDSNLMDAVAYWGDRLYDTVDQSTPEAESLSSALNNWDGLAEHDLDSAIRVVTAIEDVTRVTNTSGSKPKKVSAKVARAAQVSGPEYRRSLLPKTKSLNVEIQDEDINYEGVPYTSFDVSRTTRKGVEKRLLNVTVYQPRDENERPVVLIKGSTDDDELLASEKKAQEAYVNKLKGNANLGRLSDPKFLNPIKEVKREFTVTDPDELTRNLETLENNGYFNRFDLSYDTIRNEIGEHWMTNPRGEEMKIYTGRDYATGGMKYRFYNQRNISSTFMKEFYSKPVDGQEWEIV